MKIFSSSAGIHSVHEVAIFNRHNQGYSPYDSKN